MTGRLGRRIAVVGTSGSGKTTLAKDLAQRLQISHIELDALHWQANWTPTDKEIFRQSVTEALNGETWTIDGNYSSVRDLVWTKADTMIWLDYTLPVTFTRLVRRTFRRVLQKEALWNGNHERFWQQFFSRDSLFLWALKTHGKHRRLYPQLLAEAQYSHLTTFHFRSPNATEAWLKHHFPTTPEPSSGV